MILSDQNFETDLPLAQRPVLLFFTSAACGPCYAMQLIVDEEIDAIEKHFDLAEIDIENNPKITRHFQIKGTPTFMVVKKGEPVASRVGTQSAEQLAEWLGVCLGNCD